MMVIDKDNGPDMIVVSNSSIKKVRFQAYELVLSDINILQFAIFFSYKKRKLVAESIVAS